MWACCWPLEKAWALHLVPCATKSVRAAVARGPAAACSDPGSRLCIGCIRPSACESWRTLRVVADASRGAGRVVRIGSRAVRRVWKEANVRTRTSSSVVSFLAVCTLVLAGAGQASAQSSVSPGELERAQQTASDLSLAFAHAAESVSPSVVSVRSAVRVADRSGGGGGPRGMPPDSLLRKFFGDGFFERFGGPGPGGQGGRGGGFVRQGQGTGFIVSEDGYVMTNNHVVEGASEVRVRLKGGEERTAEVIGTDPGTDLALLKIEAGGLTPVRFGDSDALRIGEWVVAVGNPFGLESTMTSGIVSAKGRRGVGISDYEDFIQTDAAINPGNSGGPLVNLRGEVVGVSTAIATRSGGNMGIGFAIPSKMAESIYESLRDDGVVTRGYLGVTIQDLTEGLARSFGYEGTDGVLVSRVVEGGPADEAGLRDGHIITSLNGEALENMSDLRLRVASVEPGTEVEVGVYRDGRTRTVRVELGELESDADPSGADRDPSGSLGDRLGFEARTMTGSIARRLGVSIDRGVVVTEVRPLSPASRAGLRPRDVIVAIGDTRIDGARDLREALRDRDLSEGVRLTVMTGENQRYVFLRVEDDWGLSLRHRTIGLLRGRPGSMESSIPGGCCVWFRRVGWRRDRLPSGRRLCEVDAMQGKQKRKIVVGGMLVLGIAMIVIGAMAGIAPPILTGVGFLLLAWGQAGG